MDQPEESKPFDPKDWDHIPVDFNNGKLPMPIDPAVWTDKEADHNIASGGEFPLPGQELKEWKGDDDD